jgi:hypothetical protein
MNVADHLVVCTVLVLHFFVDFCYSVYNQCESFIYLDLIVKNSEIIIERYFKWWISIKLVVSCTKIINLLII